MQPIVVGFGEVELGEKGILQRLESILKYPNSFQC